MPGRRLKFLVFDRVSFACKRRSFEPRVGAVALLDLRTSIASLINSFNLCKAFSRLVSWLRASCDLIITVPAGLIRRSFIFNKRSLYTSGNEDARISKNKCTAVETLFTFCPPAPCERIACNWISRKGMDTLEDTCNIHL
jgi:hypothetical protein